MEAIEDWRGGGTKRKAAIARCCLVFWYGNVQWQFGREFPWGSGDAAVGATDNPDQEGGQVLSSE